jgi:hypothetical protein
LPALPSVPGVLRIVLKGFIDNLITQVWANVLHFRYTGGAPTGTDCGSLGSQIFSSWGTHMAPECPSPTTLDSVTVTDLTSPTAGEGAALGTNPGTRGDDSIPANAAVLIHYPVHFRYRGGHPRQYLYVGGNADLQGAAEWSTLFRAEAEGHWIDFLNAIEAMNAGGTSLSNFCAVSYVAKAVNPVPPFRRPVPVVIDLEPNNASAELEMASQRRRIGRVKR